MHEHKLTTGIIIGAAIIVVLGIIATIIVGNQINSHERSTLLIRVQNAALAVSPSLVQALDGNSADLTKPEYQSLKALMEKLKVANTDARFVYLMGRAVDLSTTLPTDKLFFYVDSEPVTSVDYSPPGQIYDDTREQDISEFEAHKPATDGPYKDRWGEWVSAYAPIFDQQGNQIAIIGIDLSAKYWQERILAARFVVGLFTLLLFGFFFLVILHLNRVAGQMANLTTRAGSLKRENEASLATASILELGKWSLNLHTEELTLDEVATHILGGSGNTVLWSDLETRLSQKSKELFVRTWNDVVKNHHERFNAIIEIKTSHDTSKDILMLGIARFNPSGELIRFSGTLQDVTKVIRDITV